MEEVVYKILVEAHLATSTAKDLEQPSDSRVEEVKPESIRHSLRKSNERCTGLYHTRYGNDTGACTTQGTIAF